MLYFYVVFYNLYTYYMQVIYKQVILFKNKTLRAQDTERNFVIIRVFLLIIKRKYALFS